MPYPQFDRSRLLVKPLAQRKHDVPIASLLDLDHRHGRAPAEQARHHALAPGIEVQDQHEGDAAVAGHGVEERLARLKPAGRGADADDRAAAGSELLAPRR